MRANPLLFNLVGYLQDISTVPYYLSVLMHFTHIGNFQFESSSLVLLLLLCFTAVSLHNSVRGFYVHSGNILQLLFIGARDE